MAGVRSREQSVMVEARGRSGGSGANRQPPPPNGGYRSTSSPQIADRIIAAIPYILPFFAAIQYGRYLFFMYPAVRAAIQPVLPAISLYHSIPFGSFICFFGLYLLVRMRRAQRASHATLDQQPHTAGTCPASCKTAAGANARLALHVGMLSCLRLCLGQAQRAPSE